MINDIILELWKKSIIRMSKLVKKHNLIVKLRKYKSLNINNFFRNRKIILPDNFYI